VRAFDADDADVEIAGESACLVRDALDGGGDVPDVDFGEVAVRLVDSGF
jgi:hypothetical protein